MSHSVFDGEHRVDAVFSRLHNKHGQRMPQKAVIATELLHKVENMGCG